MLERELSVSGLDNDVLVDLLHQTDPAGVLSIYVRAGNDRGSTIDIRNRLGDLERQLANDGAPLVADALTRTLRQLDPLLDRLLDQRSPGCGRALFVGLTAADAISFSSQLPLANRVVLDSAPFIHPLFEALDRGRPSGVVVVAADIAELYDWRLGELRPASRVLSPLREPRSERPGPVAVHTARARQTTPLREMRERREREHRARAAETAAAEVFRLADEQRWEQILVAGDVRLTNPLVAALPDRLRQTVIRDPRHLGDLDLATLSRIVRERFDEAYAERTAQLAGHVRDAALARNGAFGISEVAAALNEARVDQLVYDSERRYVGAVDAGGLLYAAGEGPSTAVEESRLTERLVERALTTGAAVTPVPGAARNLLADAGGIAARLRW
jgi:hypothetical protein